MRALVIAWKKGVLLLLLGLVYGVGLTGCQPQERNTLVLLIPGGSMRTAVAGAVAEFESEHPGIRVEVVTTPGRDYYVKSLTMLAGRAQVDLLWMGQGFGIFAGRNALLDLSPFAEHDPAFSLQSYHPQVTSWYRYRDRLYGIPYGVDLLGVAYNRDLFKAAGIPEPKADWTLEEMLDMARRLTRIDSRTGRTLVAGLGFLELDPRYYGLSLLDDDGERFALNTETGREWLQRNVDLILKERILQRGTDLESMNRLEAFINGQVAMIEFAPWDLQEVNRRALFDWDVVGIPIGHDGMRTAWASSSGFCIPRASQKPELAWELLKKLTGEAFQRQVFTSTMPALPALSGEFLAANPQPSRLAEMVALQQRMQPNARIPVFQEVDAEWTYWRDQALLGKLPVPEALAQAQSHIDRILRLHREGRGEEGGTP